MISIVPRMSSLYLTNIVGHVAQINAVITVITNSLLIYLTMYQIKQISWAYRILIMIQAEIGVIFSLLECLIRPFMHSYNASIIYFTSSKVFGASKLLRTLLSLVYATIYHIIFCIMAIQFIYRYILISGCAKKILWFRGWRVMYWMGYTTGFCIIWNLVFSSCLPDQSTMSYVKEEMEEHYEVQIEDVAGFLIIVYEPQTNFTTWRIQGLIFIFGFSFVVFCHYVVIIYCSKTKTNETNYGIPIEEMAGFLILAYEPQTNFKTWRIQGLVSLFAFSFVLCSHYAVIIYCSIRIHAKINELSLMTSSNNHRLQSQLFLTLILQIVAPSIFHHIPAFALYYAPFLNLKISFPSGIMIALFSVYPEVDSWILMGVVSEYSSSIKVLIHQFLIRQVNVFQPSSITRADPARVKIEVTTI